MSARYIVGAPPCSVDGCGRTQKAKGWCATHLSRWYQTGSVRAHEPVKVIRVDGGCTVGGCVAGHVARGYCRAHYDRVVRWGNPRPDLPIGYARYSGTISGGYRVISVGGRRVREHRHVMEQMLGRPLLPDETVHHKNGVRTDNRPENLELWVSHQPSGQRPEDLLEWADEINRRYA